MQIFVFSTLLLLVSVTLAGAAPASFAKTDDGWSKITSRELQQKIMENLEWSTSWTEGDDGAVAREEGNVPVQLVSSGDDDSDDEDDDDNPDDGGDDKPDDGGDDKPDDDDRPDDGPDDGGDDRPDDGPDGEDDRPDGGPDDDPDDDDRKDDDRDDRKEDDRNDDKANNKKDDNVEYGKPKGCIHRGTLHTIERGSVEIHQSLCLLCACQPSGLLHCFKTC